MRRVKQFQFKCQHNGAALATLSLTNLFGDHRGTDLNEEKTIGQPSIER